MSLWCRSSCGLSSTLSSGRRRNSTKHACSGHTEETVCRGTSCRTHNILQARPPQTDSGDSNTKSCRPNTASTVSPCGLELCQYTGYIPVDAKQQKLLFVWVCKKESWAEDRAKRDANEMIGKQETRKPKKKDMKERKKKSLN